MYECPNCGLPIDQMPAPVVVTEIDIAQFEAMWDKRVYEGKITFVPHKPLTIIPIPKEEE